jgi:lipopolysaccharide/colanic/teichoic acid biosynthesis glycosyltransferase
VLQKLLETFEQQKGGSAGLEASHIAMLPENLFRRLLYLERLRTERSGRHFVLMLLDCADLLKTNAAVLAKLALAVTEPTRQTDIKGWYKESLTIGVIFTEIGPMADRLLVEALAKKITSALQEKLTRDEFARVRLNFHLFPEDWGGEGPDEPVKSILQRDFGGGTNGQKTALTAKRIIDIAGSIGGLILCLPVIAVIALAIKLTSKGPVLFRQVRFGQYGRKFTFFKFRSMYVDNDHRVHEEYINRFIKGLPDAELGTKKVTKLYKLTDDPRITPLGRLLRKTSLDELPQFLNVIRGEMSLVGPRPPVMYEVERYDLWHKQRLLAVKPGITGLWQVEGRSRVKFDEMVRLDIRYARSWSIWLDIKILLQTPRAVILGSGAH